MPTKIRPVVGFILSAQELVSFVAWVVFLLLGNVVLAALAFIVILIKLPPSGYLLWFLFGWWGWGAIEFFKRASWRRFTLQWLVSSLILFVAGRPIVFALCRLSDGTESDFAYSNNFWLVYSVFCQFGFMQIAPAFLRRRFARRMPPGTLPSVPRRCKIALLRPFESHYSRYARMELVPSLGGYGVVRLVRNDEFLVPILDDEFAGLSTDDRSTPLAQPLFGNEEWQQRVLELIEWADIAVIDVSLWTPNIEYEIKCCLAVLPRERIMFIAFRGIADPTWSAKTTIDRLDGRLGSLGQPVRYNSGLMGRWQFRIGVFRWMGIAKRFLAAS